MITFDQLAGNQTLKHSLKRALADRFPQTVLLTGEDSAALVQWAKALAAALLCEHDGERPCGVCPSCHKMKQSVHADCLIIDEGEQELKVDLARKIKMENAVVPTEGSRRVTIIHHAQQLNHAAQNALLNVLEEPSAFAFFILTAEQPDALLQTVRSRCTKFALEPPSPKASEKETTALLAHYLQALADRQEDKLMLAALPLEKIPDRSLVNLLADLEAALRDAIFIAKKLPQPPLQPALRKETQAVAQKIPCVQLLAVCDLLHMLEARISRHAAGAAITCALTADVYQIITKS